MAFTNVWDVTTPPDTQPANQLGLDIRNLKTDTMERMAAISGVLASRPTPETTNADWTGLLYFATDTNQVFQWNGSTATWIEVTANIGSGIKDYDDFTNQAFAAAAPGVIRTVTIPIGALSNALSSGSIIEVETAFQITASTGAAPSYILRIKGTQVLSVTSAAFTTASTVVRVRATVVLSNAQVPRVVVELRTNNDTVAPVVVSSVLTAIDGSAPVTVQDAFGGSTTITANAFYMHVRVRK